MPTRAQLEYDRMLQAKEKIQENAKTVMKDESLLRSVDIVRNFIKTTKSICYGGTAINNILPSSSQFYDETDIPDYDFYHYDALELAKKLADLFHKQGFISVAKAGVHTNTYKVYANFVPLADITHCDRPLYEELKKRAIHKDGLLYADPNFLRMSMYLELSRPNGDITRWDKIMSRLQLLNTHYPMQSKCDPIGDYSYEESLRETHALIWNECVRSKVVFLSGVFAHLAQSKKEAYSKFVDGFHSAPDEFINKLNQLVGGVLTYHLPVGEIIPECFELSVNGTHVIRIYRTIACHGYNEILFQNQKIRVATIDTLMNMTLALSYLGGSEKIRRRYLCMAQFIFNAFKTHKLTTRGIYNRFPLTCLGKQDTLLDILRNKYNIYKEMKQNPNFMRKYDKYFLNYNPADKKESGPVSGKKTKKSAVNPQKRKNTHDSKKNPTKTKKMTIRTYLNQFK